MGLIGKLNNMIPVVLMHKGYQDYLGLTLQQANKNNDVYLLGDTKPSVGAKSLIRGVYEQYK